MVIIMVISNVNHVYKALNPIYFHYLTTYIFIYYVKTRVKHESFGPQLKFIVLKCFNFITVIKTGRYP